MTTASLTPLERGILEALAAEDGPYAAIVRAQLPALGVISRNVSSAGFFTRFSSTNADFDTAVTTRYSDIIVNLPQLKSGLGTLLFIDQGRVTALEAYTFGEELPVEIGSFEITFVGKRSSR
jgi:hypothetical protein